MPSEISGPLAGRCITDLISPLVVVDPPGNIFPYLALSAGFAPEAARALARRACFYSFVILALVLFGGRLVFNLLGITLPAFQIAGGLILFRIAFDMLEGRDEVYKRFNRPKRRTLWYYNALGQTFSAYLRGDLAKELRRTVPQLNRVSGYKPGR